MKFQFPPNYKPFCTKLSTSEPGYHLLQKGSGQILQTTAHRHTDDRKFHMKDKFLALLEGAFIHGLHSSMPANSWSER